jgi:hypothetical protein
MKIGNLRKQILCFTAKARLKSLSSPKWSNTYETKSRRLKEGVAERPFTLYNKNS